MEMNKKKKVILMAAIGAVVLVAAIVVLIVVLGGKNKIKATTMRLLRIVGEVTLEDNGTEKTIIDNLRLNDGNALSTAAASLASVGLDDYKIISVEEDSRVEFYQDGKQLELMLTKGRLFFDVKQPLADNESLDIKSSTMVVGIRGTSGYVWEDPTPGKQYLYITDGTVIVKGYNPVTQTVEEKEVHPGQRLTAYLYDDGTFNTFEVEDVAEEDLPVELIRELFNDAATLEKALNSTGYDKNKLEKLILEDDSSSYISVEEIEESEPEPEPEPEPEKEETKEEEPEITEEAEAEAEEETTTPVVVNTPAPAVTAVSVEETESEPEQSYEEPEPEPAPDQQTSAAEQPQNTGTDTNTSTNSGTNTSQNQNTISETPVSMSAGDEEFAISGLTKNGAPFASSLKFVSDDVSSVNVSVMSDTYGSYLSASFSPTSSNTQKFEVHNYEISYYAPSLTDGFLGQDSMEYSNGNYSGIITYNDTITDNDITDSYFEIKDLADHTHSRAYLYESGVMGDKTLNVEVQEAGGQLNVLSVKNVSDKRVSYEFVGSRLEFYADGITKDGYGARLSLNGRTIVSQPDTSDGNNNRFYFEMDAFLLYDAGDPQDPSYSGPVLTPIPQGAELEFNFYQKQ